MGPWICAFSAYWTSQFCFPKSPWLSRHLLLTPTLTSLLKIIPPPCSYTSNLSCVSLYIPFMYYVSFLMCYTLRLTCCLCLFPLLECELHEVTAISPNPWAAYGIEEHLNNPLLIRLLDSVGEGEGGMFQENSMETCILSRVKQITSPGWMHETSARTWCTGKTQRDRVEREVGGGIRMGNTCISKADSCQCMTKTTTIL